MRIYATITLAVLVGLFAVVAAQLHRGSPPPERNAHRATTTATPTVPQRFTDETTIFTIPSGGGSVTALTGAHQLESADDEATSSGHSHGEGGETEEGEEHEEQQVDNPIWSPDGRSIAFTRTGCEYCPPRLFVMRNDGSQAKRLSGVHNVFQPAWAPDGRHLAVISPGRRSALVSLDPEHGDTRTLWLGDAAMEAPAWSTRNVIAVSRQVGASNWDIYAVPSGGRSIRRVTRTRTQEATPAWSSDGRRLAFARQLRNGHWAIVVSRGDGRRQRRITDPAVSAVEPTWSPDGTRVAFTEQLSNDRSTIAVVRLRDGAVTRLTPRSIYATQPSWSPKGGKLTFAARRLTTEKSE